MIWYVFLFEASNQIISCQVGGGGGAGWLLLVIGCVGDTYMITDSTLPPLALIQTDLAVKMLRNLGHSHCKHFAEIAFHTSRRSVRTNLIALLSREIQFSDTEHAVIGMWCTSFHFILSKTTNKQMFALSSYILYLHYYFLLFFHFVVCCMLNDELWNMEYKIL